MGGAQRKVLSRKLHYASRKTRFLALGTGQRKVRGRKLHYARGNARFLAPGPLTTASTSGGRPAVVSVAIRDSDDRVRTGRRMLARGGDGALAKKANRFKMPERSAPDRRPGYFPRSAPGRSNHTVDPAWPRLLKASRRHCVSGHWQPLDWQSLPPRGRPIDSSGKLYRRLVPRQAIGKTIASVESGGLCSGVSQALPLSHRANYLPVAVLGQRTATLPLFSDMRRRRASSEFGFSSILTSPVNS